MQIFIKFRGKVMKIWDLKLASLYQEVSLISGIERKRHCLISTSYLAGLFQHFHIILYLAESCVFWSLFTNEDTL